ncbi:MAG TPA: ADP-ribosylglycohydrolase family protein, partial [Thermomicrobiales bacterium]|nr:ADP-ribosylglycohydrolase family protein [Thermomicrobiales bacterium]
MTIPPDYVDRVYAGVLGKIIGVYLGRPIEGWSYERIAAEIGEVDRYINDVRGMPLVVTDDDISGTFTFLRAMPDHGNDPNLTPAQIGETWLNYLIERRTILWWGGMGNSTEHTAYLRLKHGIPAPESGSIALNGKTIAEQIGAQIFIDGWGMICPGDPERAADFARRAASVSHDGEAIYGAQVVAALEAQAFVEADIDRLLDVAVAQIPADSVIARVIHDVREWHAAEADWRQTREKIAGSYGYDKFGGACHMVPNHALVVHSLLHGGGDFSRSLTIVNSCGWDTDCNSGNVGCILGIRNGLAAIDASPVDWRGPIADRLYLATADGGRSISDAVRETYEVVNIGRALQGMPPLAPKEGARFHFEAPGSVQGFHAEGDGVSIQNVARQGGAGRNLALRFPGGGAVRAVTPTFIPPEAIAMPGYTLLASPTVYPGQEIQAGVEAAPGNSEPVEARLLLRVYGPDNRLEPIEGPVVSLAPGESQTLTWTVPATFGAPIAEAGIEAAPAGD